MFISGGPRMLNDRRARTMNLKRKLSTSFPGESFYIRRGDSTQFNSMVIYTDADLSDVRDMAMMLLADEPVVPSLLVRPLAMMKVRGS